MHEKWYTFFTITYIVSQIENAYSQIVIIRAINWFLPNWFTVKDFLTWNYWNVLQNKANIWCIFKSKKVNHTVLKDGRCNSNNSSDLRFIHWIYEPYKVRSRICHSRTVLDFELKMNRLLRRVFFYRQFIIVRQQINDYTIKLNETNFNSFNSTKRMEKSSKKMLKSY